MKRALLIYLALATGIGTFWAKAEQHRATRLGGVATRFAPPLRTPEDLRSRFRDEKLKPDFAAVLKQWGWGDLVEDLHRAAAVAQISDIKIPIGAVMPFMSSREGGKPICLRNVLWAGDEPAPAYAFPFSSKGRRYRCVTPKACSNFFVEDLGPELKASLTLACNAPAEILAGRPVEVCLKVQNTGNQAEAKTTVSLVIPPGATVTRTTDGGAVAADRVTWEVLQLAPKTAKQLCAAFAMRQPGSLSFQSSAVGLGAQLVEASCASKILGIPAILLEVVDAEDPVELGKEVTYDVKVTNQGSAPGTNIRILCHVPPSQEFVSASGATVMQAQGGEVVALPLGELAPKAEASWRIITRAKIAGDSRFKVQLSSDQFSLPIDEDESTELY